MSRLSRDDLYKRNIDKDINTAIRLENSIFNMARHFIDKVEPVRELVFKMSEYSYKSKDSFGNKCSYLYGVFALWKDRRDNQIHAYINPLYVCRVYSRGWLRTRNYLEIINVKKHPIRADSLLYYPMWHGWVIQFMFENCIVMDSLG